MVFLKSAGSASKLAVHVSSGSRCIRDEGSKRLIGYRSFSKFSEISPSDDSQIVPLYQFLRWLGCGTGKISGGFFPSLSAVSNESGSVPEPCPRQQQKREPTCT